MSGRVQRQIIGAVVLALAAAALLWAWQVREREGVSHAPVRAGLNSGEDALRAHVRENFEKIASELNRQARETGGEAVALRFVDVGEGPSITYLYRVDTSRAPFDAARARRVLAGQCCGMPEMRDYMPYGVYYEYVYVDADDRELLRTRVDEAVCRALEASAADRAAEEKHSQ